MNSTNLYLLLRIVKHNRSINALLKEKLTFKQIGDLTEKALELNLIIKKDSSVILTNEGEDVYMQLAQKYKKINKDEWIERETTSMIESFNIDFLYLPDQRNLNLD